jgi:ubiquinone/menaquinone biosynthesis C-methylase UbiE
VAFDRAAEYYDRTRTLPPGAMARITEMVAGELKPRGPSLEIGVGTGRIALPLAERGVRMVGADLSMPMLRQLFSKAGGRSPFPLVQADATALPFADDAFSGALVVHVLHLVAEWRAMLGELARVVRPGGVILVDMGAGRGSRSQWTERIQERFRAETGLAEEPRIGIRSQEDVEEAMRDLGARARDLPAVRSWRLVRAEDGIASLEAGEYSWEWGIDPEVLRRSAAATRRWARREFGPLDRPRRQGITIRYRAFDLPKA